MAFELKDRDHKKIDVLSETILNAYRAGEVSLSQATYLFGHLIAAAAKDNEAVLKEWLDPTRVSTWKVECANANRA